MVARVMLSREERGCVAAQQAWLRHFWSQAAKVYGCEALIQPRKPLCAASQA